MALLAVVPTPASAQPAANTSALAQVTFTSAGNGRALDVQNGTAGDGSIIVTNQAPGYDESWRVATGASDASFTIVNNTTGKCIDAGTPLRQQSCDGRSSEQWYFEPVAGSAVHAVMIRQAGDNSCLDVLLAAQYNDAWTDTYGCNNTAAQQWILPAAAYPAVWGLAVDHAAAQCAKDTSTCSWTTTSQTGAAPLPSVCVSPVWYNGTSAPASSTLTISTQTGWSSTIGFMLSSSLGTGAASPLQAVVSTQVTGSITYNVVQDLGNSLTITVPAGQYGWVELSELATKVTGRWTFDTKGFAWSADDTVTVPLKTSDSGASIYLARTAPAFTSCSV